MVNQNLKFNKFADVYVPNYNPQRNKYARLATALCILAACMFLSSNVLIISYAIYRPDAPVFIGSVLPSFASTLPARIVQLFSMCIIPQYYTLQRFSVLLL